MNFVSITTFGAKGDGQTDNSAPIQAAFDFAKANGLAVFIPAGVFAHSGTLSIDGIHVFGVGEGSVLRATQYGQEALYLRGDATDLSDLRIEGVNGARLTTDPSARVVVEDATNFAIENIHIVGSSSAGIKVNSSANGYIANNLVENTKADSIHMVLGSHHILVEQNRTVGSGDDGISVVSYRGGGTVHDITVRDNEVLDNGGGRGLSVLGGSDIVIEHNTVESSAGNAGIYIAAEQEFDTEAAHNVQVRGNTVIDAGGPTSRHGAITLYNSQDHHGLANDGITIADNEIIDPRLVDIAIRGADLQTAAIYDNPTSGGEAAIDNSVGAQLSLVRPAGQPDIAGTDTPELLDGTNTEQALYGRGGADQLLGQGGNDLLDGGNGDDILLGSSGNDRLFGASGSDLLHGGTGNDLLDSGPDNDVFVFGPGHDIDTIRSFDDGDRLDLRGFGIVDLATLAQKATISTGTAVGQVPFVQLSFATGEQLQVVRVAQLTADDLLS